MIANAGKHRRRWLGLSLPLGILFLAVVLWTIAGANPQSAALLAALALSGWAIHQHNRHGALQKALREQEQRHSATQRELEHSGRRFRQLLDNAGDAIFFIDPRNGKLLLANRQAEEMLGYSVEEIHALALPTLFPGRHKRRYLRLMRRVLRDGYGEEASLHFRHKDGHRFIGAVHARLGELDDEQVVHGVIRDVTKVRQAEQQLRRKNRELTLLNEIARRIAEHRGLDEVLQAILEDVISVFEAHGGGIFLVSTEGNLLQLAAYRNVEPEVLADIRRIPLGIGLAGRVAVSGHPQASADLQKDLRLRSAAIRSAGWRGFQAIPLATGDKTLGVLFLYNRDRRVLGREEIGLLMAIGHQVGSAIQGAELYEALRWQNRLTEASNRELQRSRRQLNENLAQAQRTNRELARLERMKSNFMALASHELRTPLTCILSGAQLLQQSLACHLKEEDDQLFDALLQSGLRLDAIVRDMLEAARLESDSLYLAREKVDLRGILHEVQCEFAPVFAERRLQFSLQQVPGVELTGDAYHLRRTFARLLENAVKYTPAGGDIQLRGQMRCFAEVQISKDTLSRFSPTFFKETAPGPLVQITVADNGIGIEPEEQLRIFDKFYEIGDIDSHSTSRTRFGGKGVGLGLTLVKGMVEAHGGMVWVECPSAGGSAFHVLLPAVVDSVKDDHFQELQCAPSSPCPCR